MKLYSFSLVLFLIIVGCKKDGRLAFEEKNVTIEECSSCPKVQLDITHAIGHSPISKDINHTIEKEVIKILSFGEPEGAKSYKEAVKKFRDESAQLKKEFPDESVSDWEAIIKGNLSYESEFLASIKIESYMYSGGAHGYGATTYLNFDKRTGELLENWELFKNPDDFTTFAEVKFRIQEDIPTDVGINSTGFMFDKEMFELPDNIGFLPGGLELIYNQYEIASYADGQKTLRIPYDEIKQFMNIN